MASFSSRLEQLSSLSIFSEPGQLRMTSIICTIGPNTQSVEALTNLRKAGMSIVRMNFSHGSHEFHEKTIVNTRKSTELHPSLRSVAIALDTKGPEIRTGMIKNNGEITLEKGKVVTLTTDKAREQDGDVDTIYVDYTNLPTLVSPGKRVFIDDGLLSLEVIEQGSNFVKCKILNTAKISSRKGVNLPDTKVDLPAVSEKDIADLKFGVKHDVDMVFASFIRKADDVKKVREILGEEGKHIKIISKIENREGVEKFQEILNESDGIMVARGDLGIEIDPEKVFLAQKMMISRSNKAGKPVICATQMLESMTYNPRPTRAEVSDVANAVLDGADCVMLSGETAKGIYPIETVAMMNNICREAESAIYHGPFFNEIRALTPKPLATPEAVASSSVNASLELHAAAIICLTTSGDTAALLSKYRPPCPVIAITRSARTSRFLHLYRGCLPVHVADDPQSNWQDDVDARLNIGVEVGKNAGFLKSGDQVVAIQGWKKGTGYTNTIRLLPVP